jgi:aspartyl-tRNA(Asn)/glutamyl-tRNA(Gln) amidotransferase subunit B
MLSDYDVVIGLEIHAQLATESKCFSGASTNFGLGHNENVTAVCAGMPGTLPVLNEKAVELAVRTALVLGCEVQPHSVFARKQYFYPDMPKGYQISQYDQPIALNGIVEFYLDGVKQRVPLERAHMEEDAGKSTHFGEYTLINLNRAGIPLLEIVSKPAITSSRQAAAYARSVRQALRYAEVCDGNLEEGSLRCDCNVSLKPKGQEELGTRVELKNINSFRFIEKALDYEIQRQLQSLQIGEKIVKETRLYDSVKNKTFSMRKKEEANDYRYFPEPDLMPLNVSEEQIARIRESLPEHPTRRFERFMESLNLKAEDAELLTSEKVLADFFEKLAKVTGHVGMACNWMTGEFLRLFNDDEGSTWDSFPMDVARMAELLQQVIDKKVSANMAKEVFEEMWATGKTASAIIKERGLMQITDDHVIAPMIEQILQTHQGKVAEYRSGKQKLFGFFVGQVMKDSKGQASPEVVNRLLKEKLK